MINIAFIASSLKIGGAERQWQELIGRIDKGKFKITLICLYKLGEIGEEIRLSGVKSYANLLKSRFSLLSINVLKNILKTEKVDICFLWNQPLTMFYGILAAKLAKIKGIITVIHSTGFLNRKLRSYFVNKMLTRYVDKIVAVGTYQKEHLVRLSRLPAEKITVIFNGVDINKYEGDINRGEKKKELGINGDHEVVGIVGRLHVVKRHDIFLRAAKQVLQQYPKVTFLIIGDGKERRKIERSINELGLSPHVKMLGLRNDIVDINKIVNVSVLSSDSEALPMTIIESMASTVPFVATNVGSVPDLIINGENGFLVPPSSPDMLAEAILRILKDQNLAKKMGERGHQIARANFSVETMVRNYERLFSEIKL